MMVDFHDGCESEGESDVPIPKRKWGENYMNGLEQTIEEEFGEICDESVASLSDNESLKNVSIHGKDDQVKEIQQASSDTRELSVKSCSSSSNNTSSFNESKKKNKTKNKVGKKAKKESTLPPLKSPPLAAVGGGLPPLKEKRMFFRGLPLASNNNKSPEKLRQDGMEQEPKLTSNINRSSLENNTEIKNSSVVPSMTNDLIKEDSYTNNKITSPSSKMNQQQSEQTLVTPVKSQKSNSLLGDLPPLSMASASSSKSTIMVAKGCNKKITANDIFGAGPYDECEDVDDDEESFGDDDIDALLGGLDQFDAQRKSQQ